MNNIEYEYKIIITHDNYQKLQNYLKTLYNNSTYTQVNIYFDDHKNTLKQNKSALRIRQLNSTLEWTFKQSYEKYKKLELKQLTLFDNFDTIEKPILSKLHELNISTSNLKQLCKITTTRTDFKFLSSTLSLDYNVFNDNINHFDYELELEIFNENDLNQFKDLMKKFNIEHIQAKNKVARAINFENN